jgi:uncharacterized membrane protein (DUF4010 family)
MTAATVFLTILSLEFKTSVTETQRGVAGPTAERPSGPLYAAVVDATGLGVGVLVAMLGGAAIGIERERSGKASGAGARFGGLRTFTLIGVIAGLAGALASHGAVALAVVLASGVVAIVGVAYAVASRNDIDATTEVAALVVLAAGILAGMGQLAIASGIIAVTAVLLVEKPRLHAFAKRIDDDEMRAAAVFGLMALVILPVLPEGPYGPLGGVRPRELWMLVLFFTGLSFAGYLARRAVGATMGYPVAGLLGGLVSSTSVTLTFSRLSRHQVSLARPLAIGVIAACTVLFPRVMLATSILDRRVALALLPYLAAPFLIGVAAVVAGLRHRSREQPDAETLRNPLQLWSALQMVVMFQVVLFLVSFVKAEFGEAGLLATGAVLGLTDVDALTVSMTRGAANGIAPAIAAQAIAIGILSNTLLKSGLAVVLGTSRFRRLAGIVLGAMCFVLGAAWWFLRP